MQITAANFAYALYCASLALAAPATKRQSGTSYDGGNTADDVTNGVCAPVTLIFARGSTESGNMGSSVGPALAKQLISSLGASGVAIQGVDYPATIESNISMGSEGGPEMAKLAQQALSQCPDTKIALSGYSQGATVTHYAVGDGGLDGSSVAAAVLYGDPEYHSGSFGDLSTDRVKEFCASGDGVCETGTFSITAAHLSYTTGSDIPDGAAFIVQNAGTSTSTGGSSSSSAAPVTESSSASSSDPFGGIFGGLFGGSGGGF